MPTDPNTLPPVPSGSLLDWITRRPDEVRAYLGALRSITRAPGLQRARQNAILPSATVVQSTVVPAPTPSGEYTVPVMEWTSQASSVNSGWRAVCWSPELRLFCAVANSGDADKRIMTSPDGVNWTTQTSPNASGFGLLCDGGSIIWVKELGLFVGVSALNFGGSSTDRVFTSPDGVTWTTRSAATATAWRSLCWSPEVGLLVAVADSGTANRVMTSPDGINWTTRTPAADIGWRSVCWSRDLGLFCAVGSNGSATTSVMTSPDGINWTSQRVFVARNWNSVCWSPSRKMFLAIASNTGEVVTSFDGVVWDNRSVVVTSGFLWVTWAEEAGVFVAVGQNNAGRRAMYSRDGILWHNAATPADNQWWGLCWSPELEIFVAVSDTGSGNRVMTGTVTDL